MIEKDPVCGMPVDTKRAGSSLSFEHNGRIYYFCSPRCRERFEAELERYTREHQTRIQNTERKPEEEVK